MNLKEFKKKKLIFILFCLFCFLAGGISGFLGTGGGIIFIFMLSALTKNEDKDNYATSLCATLAISLTGLLAYLKNSNVDFEIIGQVWLPAVLGGALGAFLVDKMQARYLNAIFGALIVYSGFNMLLK